MRWFEYQSVEVVVDLPGSPCPFRFWESVRCRAMSTVSSGGPRGPRKQQGGGESGSHDGDTAAECAQDGALSQSELFGDLFVTGRSPRTVAELEGMVVPPDSFQSGGVDDSSRSGGHDPLVDLASEMLPPLSNDQVKALRSISSFLRSEVTDSPQVFVVAGYAGVGKTTILGPIAEWCKRNILPYNLLAFTNSAVDTARNRTPELFSKSSARTLHSTLYGAPVNGRFTVGSPKQGTLQGIKVVFVDEASLVPTDVMRDLLSVAQRRGIKVVVFGDPFQLGAVETTEKQPFEPLKIPSCEMTQVVRQGADSGVLSLATSIRNTGEAKVPRVVLPDLFPGPEVEGAWRFPRTPEGAVDLFMDLWARNEGGVFVIVAGNRERVAFNKAVRTRLHGHRLDTLYPNEPLMVLGNTREFSNGARIVTPEWISDARREFFTFRRYDAGSHQVVEEQAIVFVSKEPDEETNNLRKIVLFPETLAPSIALMSLVGEQGLSEHGKRELEVLCTDAIPVTPYYVGTCHKAQGKEWDDVIVIPPGPNAGIRRDRTELARWAYTAFTRARMRAYCEVGSR